MKRMNTRTMKNLIVYRSLLLFIMLRTMVERLQRTRQFFVCRICLFLWIMCHTAILIFIKRDSMM